MASRSVLKKQRGAVHRAVYGTKSHAPVFMCQLTGALLLFLFSGILGRQTGAALGQLLLPLSIDCIS